MTVQLHSEVPTPATTSAHRARASVVLASLGAFVALAGCSVAIYPGGSWVDRAATHHSFWNNLLCDLVQPIALNGTPNPVGSRLAQAAMLALVTALGAHWALIATLIARQPRTSRLVFSSGILACLSAVAIPLTPSQRFGEVHTLAVLLAAVPTLVAGTAAVVGLFRAGISLRLQARLGFVAFSLCLLDVLACARQIATAAPITTGFAVLQRAALLGLFAWLVPTALRAASDGGRVAAP